MLLPRINAPARRAAKAKVAQKRPFIRGFFPFLTLAEKGQNDSRGSHHGSSRLDHPEKFLDNAQTVNLSPRMLLERLRQRQGGLFQSLAGIGLCQAWFNPVRDYNDELKQGKSPPR